MYLRDCNFPQAYLLYLRYSTLVVDLLKTHPEAKTPEAKKALQNKFLTIDVVFKHLEEIKPILEQQYEAWKEAKAKKKAKLGHHRQSSGEESKELSTYQLHASKDPALSYASRLLDAGENQDLAVELAKKEIQRRDADRRATEKNGETRRGQQLQQQRRTAGFWDTWTQDIVDKQAEDEEVFRRQMESTRRTLDRDTDSPPTHLTHATDRPLKPPSMPAYSYPKIARSAPVDYSPQHFRSNESKPSQPLPPPQTGGCGPLASRS